MTEAELKNIAIAGLMLRYTLAQNWLNLNTAPHIQREFGQAFVEAHLLSPYSRIQNALQKEAYIKGIQSEVRQQLAELGLTLN